ncbi:hypothetical protein TWF281_009234 [Arthrobotrys megalospora]
MLLRRTLLTSLSSSTRRPFVAYTSTCIRRIHITRTLWKEPEDIDPKTYAVLRDIIQQTSIMPKSNKIPQKGEEEEGEATNLLITLDALGTLYEIKNADLGQEYGRVAKKCGLKKLSDQAIAKSFKEAYKELAASHPNYGYATGMTPKEWWEQLTIKTFTPLIPPTTPFPKTLAESLWTHFSTSAAYSILPGTLPFLWIIKDLKTLANNTRNGITDWKFRTITIGVISNSDDRVIDVLNSMDIATSHRVTSLDGEVTEIPLKSLKHKQTFRELERRLKSTNKKLFKKVAKAREEVMRGNQAMDFVVTSCRLGVAKPQKGIFEAARKAAERLVAEMYGGKEAAKGWEWYHVGDNPKEDVVGAYEAGAVGILYEKGKDIGETEGIVEGNVEGEGYKTMVIGDMREVAEFTEGLGLLYQSGGQKVTWAAGADAKFGPQRIIR